MILDMRNIVRPGKRASPCTVISFFLITIYFLHLVDLDSDFAHLFSCPPVFLRVPWVLRPKSIGVETSTEVLEFIPQVFREGIHLCRLKM
jgi:hypothetical protein